jgi:hypothetical protein
VSLTSPDARAVVRAIDALTEEVRRLADAQPAPVDNEATTADDGPTPAFTSPIAGRIEVREPCPWCADRPMIPRTLMDEHVARLHPEVHTGGPGIPVPDAESPAADEDQTLRWARRESLLVLVTRVQRGRALTEDEARTLREHVETEMHEAEQARAAIERVRAIPESWEQMPKGRHVYIHEAARTVRAALDGTEQPTTEA